MKTWDTKSLDVEPHRPEILSSTDAARVIVINLPEGEELQDHRVHERTFLLVVDGTVELQTPGGDTETAGPGTLAELDPGEEHEVRATGNSRLLLILAPWPGDGHPGAMSLEDKANARERAHERSEG